ncbi:FecR family protein [Sphingopyxis sp. MWB1]|uniref:FecR family protein n=1 Tax=Sphingopyxis sp. MWB1 TaxID=1537715 RepID=UPI00068C9603|nr:FecR domain-containing protein [Sphingopyxis sp. MWB1]
MPDSMLSAAEQQAIEWLIRQRDPDFSDWDGFTDWLSAAPSHAEVYDALASLDRDLDDLKAPARPAQPLMRDPALPQPRRQLRRRAWIAGAAVAALAIITLPSLGLFDGVKQIETAAGEQRTIQLADGSTIALNGSSSLEIDEARPRFARLDQGEAMFTIVHQASAPFVVEAGPSKIVDLGTAFNVVRRADTTSVAVSEGVVVYNPDHHNVRMTAGEALEARDGEQALAKRPVDVANVGGWRSGLLVYNGTPLAIVAEDLRRTAGVDIRVAPEAADFSFRGALVIDKDRSRTVADLATLSGTRAERRGEGWMLTR